MPESKTSKKETASRWNTGTPTNRAKRKSTRALKESTTHRNKPVPPNDTSPWGWGAQNTPQVRVWEPGDPGESTEGQGRTTTTPQDQGNLDLQGKCRVGAHSTGGQPLEVALATGQPEGNGHLSKQGRGAIGWTHKKPREVGVLEGAEGKEGNPQPQGVPRDPGHCATSAGEARRPDDNSYQHSSQGLRRGAEHRPGNPQSDKGTEDGRTSS